MLGVATFHTYLFTGSTILILLAVLAPRLFLGILFLGCVFLAGLAAIALAGEPQQPYGGSPAGSRAGEQIQVEAAGYRLDAEDIMVRQCAWAKAKIVQLTIERQDPAVMIERYNKRCLGYWR